MYETFVCDARHLQEELNKRGGVIHSITYLGKTDVLVVLQKAAAKETRKK